MKRTLMVLNRDISNPHGDARHTRDWRKLLVIPKGARLVVEKGTAKEVFGIIDVDMADNIVELIFPVGLKVYAISPKQDLFPLIMSNLEPAPETLKNVLDELGVSPLTALKALLESCGVTLHGIRESVIRMEERIRCEKDG